MFQIASRMWPGLRFLAQPRAARALVQAALRPATPDVRDNAIHARAAIEWLFRAQDRSASADGGVSRSYDLVRNPGRRSSGWLASYPETTGYIIPTFLAYARAFGDAETRRRGLRMADWECSVQMANGAVQGGMIDEEAVPTTFNTGQVIFGWLAAHRETGDERCLRSAMRAGAFLVETQDADGAWRKHRSRFVSESIRTTLDAYAYEVRSAWGLLELWKVTGDERFRTSAEKNLRFALALQRDNGWFAQNCIHDSARPLLHTIAYAAEGVLEAGVLLEEKSSLSAAARTADALLALQRPDGSLAARFDASWIPRARWSCLTGDAQVSRVWLRLFALTGTRAYLDAARRMNRFLKTTQDLSSVDDGVRGGISGSHPIHGSYAPFSYLSWAAKFFIDALLLEGELAW